MLNHDKFFAHLVDNAAFIHKLILSIWNVAAPQFAPEMELLGAPILTGGRRARGAYGYRQRTLFKATGNPVEVAYARLVKLRHVPMMQVRIRSVARPITHSEVRQILSAVAGSAVLYTISSVELTFDVNGFCVRDLARMVYTPARRLHRIPPGTVYFGAPRCPWQLKVYSKPKAVTRFEATLRPKFLKSVGVNGLEDLPKLATFDLSCIVRFQRFDPDVLAGLDPAFVTGWRGDTLDALIDQVGLRKVHTLLRQQYRGKTAGLLVKADLQACIDRMQQALIWEDLL